MADPRAAHVEHLTPGWDTLAVQLRELREELVVDVRAQPRLRVPVAIVHGVDLTAVAAVEHFAPDRAASLGGASRGHGRRRRRATTRGAATRGGRDDARRSGRQRRGGRHVRAMQSDVTHKFSFYSNNSDFQSRAPTHAKRFPPQYDERFHRRLSTHPHARTLNPKLTARTGCSVGW